MGRIGGEVFLVLCPGAGPAEASRLRDRITQALAEPVAWNGASATDDRGGQTGGRPSPT